MNWKLACVLSAAAALGLSPARRPEPRMAVVRISDCFKVEKYPHAKELYDKVDSERQTLLERVKQADDDYKKAIDFAKLQPEGSDGQMEAIRKLKLAEVELQMQQAIANDKGVNGKLRARAELYNEVLKAIEAVAKDRYDVVLKFDDSRPDPKDKPELINQQLALRDVLYAGASVDITDKVLEQLNRK